MSMSGIYDQITLKYKVHQCISKFVTKTSILLSEARSVMMIAGDQVDAVHFLSLSPTDNPLPACLSGTKNRINKGPQKRLNPLLFLSNGNQRYGKAR